MRRLAAWLCCWFLLRGAGPERAAGLALMEVLHNATAPRAAPDPLLRRARDRAAESRARCGEDGAGAAEDSFFADVVLESSCSPPPASACEETHFTIVMMAYRGTPTERLTDLRDRIEDMLHWPTVFEIVLVWNGGSADELGAEAAGRALEDLAEKSKQRFRIKVFARNSLLNRYHPDVAPATAAVMYLDDDGPFPSAKVAAVGFELWKTSSARQVGALGRALPLRAPPSGAGSGSGAVPLRDGSEVHCRGDRRSYHYKSFAAVHAQMVLPSMSFLHASYLCYVWSESFERVRSFVDAHPTMPDDIAVSFIVAQLSGLAPATFPSKLRPQSAPQSHARSLALWNPGEGWAEKREDALNWLASYFGSVNGGSAGWCDGTPLKVQNTARNAVLKYLCTTGSDGMGVTLPWMDATSPAHCAPPNASAAAGDGCAARVYPSHRVYDVRGPEQRYPPFLRDAAYVRGAAPRLLGPALLQAKLCLRRDEDRRLDLLDADGHNPTMLRHPSSPDLFLATVVVSRGQCVWPPRQDAEDPRRRPRTALLLLDERMRRLAQATVKLLLDGDAWGSRRAARGAFGDSGALLTVKLDDAKLFRFEHARAPSGVWITYRHPAAFGHARQLLNPLHFSGDGDGFSAHIVASETVRVCCGRNIAFFASGGALMAVPWVHPLTVAEVDVTSAEDNVVSAARPSLDSDLAQLHGTSGGLAYLRDTDEWLGIAHFHRPYGRQQSPWALHGHHYTHVAFTISAARPHELRRLSNEFCFPSLRDAAVCDVIQYAGGLEVAREGGEDSIYISYGVNDCESAVLKVPLAALDRFAFEDVG